MIPISSISGDSGRIVVWGDVFDIEKKVTKSGDKNIFTIDITDYTGSTTAKVFNSIKESAVIDNIKKAIQSLFRVMLSTINMQASLL